MNEPLTYDLQVSGLMDQREEREKEKKTWLLNHVMVVGFLRGACGLDLSADDIHRAIGLLRYSDTEQIRAI